MSRNPAKFLTTLCGTAALLLAGCGGGDGAPKAKKWTAPEPVETYLGHVRDPDLAMDANGNAIVVFDYNDGTAFHALYNRFVPGQGWGLASPLEYDLNQNAVYPIVAMNSSGFALAVWSQGAADHIWSSQYVPNKGWSQPELLDTGGGTFYTQVKLNENGDGLAVWLQSTGLSYDLWGRSFVKGKGWQAPVAIQLGLSGESPHLTIDSHGNGMVLFAIDMGTSNEYWVSQYDRTSGWSYPEQLSSGSVFDGSGSLAMEGAGTALATWTARDGMLNKIFVTRYVPGTGWESVQPLANSTMDQWGSQVVLTSSGSGMAIWNQSQGATVQVMANQYLPGTGWQTPVRLDDGSRPVATEPSIAIDASGNALAAWLHVDGALPREIQAAWFQKGNGWSAPVTLSDVSEDALDATPAVTPDGRGMVVWRQGPSGQVTVWSSRYE